MESPSLERRVEILEQTVELLQDLPPRMAKVEAEIVQLRTEMNSGFSALSYLINKMHVEIMARFDGVERRFEAVDKRFERVDARLDAMDERFDAMDARFDAMDRRFDGQDRDIAAIKKALE
jgi:archaellum component FlaC